MMMNTLLLKKINIDIINNNIRNLFTLKKEISNNIIKDFKKRFRLKEGNAAIKDRLNMDITNLFGR